jgi:5S rRNA maturation endonuclease (ribonuclease M5)
MKMAKRRRAFLLFFDKKGKRIRRMMEVTIKGTWGIQSWNTQYIIFQGGPVTSV